MGNVSFVELNPVPQKKIKQLPVVSHDRFSWCGNCPAEFVGCIDDKFVNIRRCASAMGLSDYEIRKEINDHTRKPKEICMYNNPSYSNCLDCENLTGTVAEIFEGKQVC